MDHSSGRSHGCRLIEYTHRNMTFLAMENEFLRVAILVDKGADIVEFLYKPTDTGFLWKEPAGIRDTGKQRSCHGAGPSSRMLRMWSPLPSRAA